MTIESLSFIFGALLVLIGLLGGGFEVKELRIPRISGMNRIVAALVGIVFICLGVIKSVPSVPGPVPQPKPNMSSMEWDTDRTGLDIQDFDLSRDDPKACEEACENNPECKAWTYVKPNSIQGPKPRCWLKHTTPQPRNNTCCVSGTRLQ